MEKFFKMYRLKVIMVCYATLIIVIVAFHLIVYVTTKRILEDQMGLGARSIAVSIASNLMYNVEEYKEFSDSKDVNSEFYVKMVNYFDNIKNNSNVKYIFSERKISDNTIEFLLDAELPGSPEYALPGVTMELDEERKVFYANPEPMYFRVVSHPVFGDLIPAVAPIFDTDGTLLGMIGVNIENRELSRHMDRLQFMMFILYAIIFVAAFFILRKYSSTMLEPMLEDKLTGALNRIHFDKYMQDEMKFAVKNKTDLSILMLDLDFFKKVNDTYGHGFGDKVLQSVSRTVKTFMKKDDYFVRYGGEEFVVIMPNEKREDVIDVAERIRKAIEHNSVYNEELNIPVHLTISIGIAFGCDLTAEHNVKTLLEQADKALYDAKRTRNSVVMY